MYFHQSKKKKRKRYHSTRVKSGAALSVEKIQLVWVQM